MRIRELREQAGLTQDQIAEHMCVDQTAVHRWEIGKAMPRAAKLPELAELLHCTIDELYGRDSPPAAG
ncbi:helix-turn-helix transcriptional regulator [uncultured Oscillibacter sp.]|uniref:helix-turn-helix domain-containing protein n=1 Tax=uncultured Oscillibacter sp. TaxID=876091 RepID=UPI0025D641D0|nr:helix-turn-helix transcriptional regulator [uncultured Oscillibacter sp.]